MASPGKRTQKTAGAVDDEVLNRAHLAHYTLDSAELEREIVALFLQQLPSTIGMLRGAKSATDWKMAAHTVKGSAAAVGATRINAIASELEEYAAVRRSAPAKALLVELDHAAERFKETVGRIYG